jgi:oligopeptide/dipeptide ABC transporter ATP-binding protein
MGVLGTNQDLVNLARPSSPAGGDLLCVCDLSVNFRMDSEPESRVLKQLSFTIASGEVVGLLGESGSGKTITALSIMRMLPANARITAGSIRIHGRNLLTLNEAKLREIRGSEISMITQDSDVLNPVMRIGNQVLEVYRAHKRATATEMRAEIYSLFTAMRLDDCDRIYRAFPHQLSGGERRRVAIAQALVCKPALVIADEPTSWLDPVTTAEILSVFHKLKEAYDTALLLISHDPTALRVADRVLVMYAGEIVESGPLPEVFEHPKHPYTIALLGCWGDQGTRRPFPNRQRLFPCIPGQAPDPAEALPGCAFSARCGHRMAVCDSGHPELIEIAPLRSTRCYQYEVRG